MYKCDYCHTEFESPKMYRESYGEEFEGCPWCGGTFDEVEQCKQCQGYIDCSGYIYKGFCEDCANEAFTPDLALKFIRETVLPELDLGEFSDAFGDKAAEDIFMFSLSLMGENPKVLQKVQEYCFNDMDYWIDFLIQEDAI